MCLLPQFVRFSYLHTVRVATTPTERRDLAP